jgi:hypothetical protein
MTMSESDVLALMRENAALCNLEAEVIVALKAYDIKDYHLVESQLRNIVVCLQRIDDVRRRNSDTPLHETP